MVELGIERELVIIEEIEIINYIQIVNEKANTLAKKKNLLNI